jgi:NADPH-dependent ferric siderophore reductase
MASTRSELSPVAGRLRAKFTVEHFTIADAAPLSRSLIRVVVRVRNHHRVHLVPGLRFALCVDGLGGLISSTWRRFTISDVDAASGTFGFVGYCEGDRPAAAWLRQVRAGGDVQVRALESVVSPIVTRGSILIGDETAIGTFAAREVSGSVIDSVLLVTEHSEDALVPGVDPSFVSHCPSIHDAVRRLGRLLAADGSARVSIVGGRELVVAIKQSLQANVPRGELMARTYWTPGKRGME